MVVVGGGRCTTTTVVHANDIFYCNIIIMTIQTYINTTLPLPPKTTLHLTHTNNNNNNNLMSLISNDDDDDDDDCYYALYYIFIFLTLITCENIYSI